MSLCQKLFRKFFYEHSSYIETETVFVEVTDSKLMNEVFGPDTDDRVVCV